MAELCRKIETGQNIVQTGKGKKMGYEISGRNAELIQDGAMQFAGGSAAMINGICAVVIAVQSERIESLSLKAAQRPKVTDIQVAARIAFGGESKDVDRGRYETCGLAFRLLAKLEKKQESILIDAVQSRSASGLASTVCKLIDHDTVAALRQWVNGEKKQAEPKAGDVKLIEYLDKNQGDYSDAGLMAAAALIATIMERRTRLAAELAALKEAA